jgi:uncharacterized protein YlxW (UPF0749 family)
MNNELEGNDLILMDVIDTLRGNLATLGTQSTLEIPRTVKNIDSLEAYLVKNLKLKLNDDNKQSQAQIASMKGRFDLYQKFIDTLNGKVDDTKKAIEDMNETFNDED